MADDTAHPNQRDDVRKPGVRPSRRGAGAGREAIRLTVRALGELLGGVAEASAEAFRGFNAKLEGPSAESEPASGVASNVERSLAADVADGLAEGNARFLEGMAKVSRQTYDQMKTGGEQASSAGPPEIDYERLARHVAIELQKMNKKD